QETWGWVEVGGAAAFALAFWVVRGYNRSLGYTHTHMAIVLLTVGLSGLLKDNALFFALAAEAAALHLISYRFSERGAGIWGHLLFGAVGIWLASRLVPGSQAITEPITNAQALTDLAVMGMAVAVSF